MVRVIDLFAGMSGIRTGVEQAFNAKGIETLCVFTSEIKPHAIEVLRANHPGEEITGDITQVNSTDIPDFDVLLAGFPCQAFSSAGNRKGFADTRGTMFFQVERILRDKRPYAFILENVEGLVNHDKGNTLRVILHNLNALGYHVSWKVLNSKYFGVPQERKRIIITGTREETISLDNFQENIVPLGSVLDYGQHCEQNRLAKILLSHYSPKELYGKSIKDKRGGSTNIHSWDIELKGTVSKEQKELLNELFKQRRKKSWAEEIGIDWMDGMPLTLKQIQTFMPSATAEMLDDLVEKGYLKFEHPKKLVRIEENGVSYTVREYDMTLPKGYNIVAGKLSFEINRILDPNDVAPTMVAMDMQKNYVVDGKELRRLTLREGLRMFGYPDTFVIPVSEKDGFDLLGNTVVVPVIRAVADRVCDSCVAHGIQ